MAKPEIQELEPTEVLVVGAGPTGLMLTHCLTQWNHSVRLVDDRPESLKAGRADGVQPHTLDVLVSLNLIEHFKSLGSSKFDTVAFWDPDSSGEGIELTSKGPTCPPEIGARHPWTSTLHQGLIEDMFLHHIQQKNCTVQRPWTIDSFEVDDHRTHPVKAVLKDLQSGRLAITRAKYLFGAQGGKSTIRDQLHIPVIYYEGSLQPTAWAVIDAPVQTDFPGISWKNNIHSATGSMMIIPRENGQVRFYIQSQRPLDQEVPSDEAHQLVKDILKPYSVEFGASSWETTYKVGQGRADRYTSSDDRVLLGGDSCHTHSPKAGQGMNTGLLDAVNLAWKIHAVESGFAKRELLQTYETERSAVARSLLDFDAKYTKLFSEKRGKHEAGSHYGGDEDEFVKTAQQNVRFTSGMGTHYSPGIATITATNAPDVIKQVLLEPYFDARLEVGRVFPCADVRRVIDGETVHAEQIFPMNGAFRLVLYPGDDSDPKALLDFAAHVVEPGMVLAGQQTTSGGSRSLEPSTFIETAVIFSSVTEGAKAESLLPTRGLVVAASNVYTDSAAADSRWSAYGSAGIGSETGAAVVVRPDGYVGCAVHLVPGAASADAVNAYFEAVMTKPAQGGLGIVGT